MSATARPILDTPVTLGAEVLPAKVATVVVDGPLVGVTALAAGRGAVLAVATLAPPTPTVTGLARVTPVAGPADTRPLGPKGVAKVPPMVVPPWAPETDTPAVLATVATTNVGLAVAVGPPPAVTNAGVEPVVAVDDTATVVVLLEDYPPTLLTRLA